MWNVNPHSKLSLFRASDEDFIGFYSGFLIFGSPLKKGVWKLNTVNDCLPMSCLKYHDCLWKVSLIKLDTVWEKKKNLNIQKTKIMASGPITSWQIEGEKVEAVTDFIFWGPQITADGDYSHEIKKSLLLGRKAMTNLEY